MIEVRVVFIGVKPGKKQEYVVWMLPALEMMQPTVDRVQLVVPVRWLVSCCPVVHGANQVCKFASLQVCRFAGFWVLGFRFAGL